MFQYLIEFKYENREIPNSLRGSLSCLEFWGSQNENAIKYAMQDNLMYNIPNWKFGMLHKDLMLCSHRWLDGAGNCRSVIIWAHEGVCKISTHMVLLASTSFTMPSVWQKVWKFTQEDGLGK